MRYKGVAHLDVVNMREEITFRSAPSENERELLDACKEQDIERVTKTIASSSRVDIDVRDAANNMTPLMIAAEKGNKDIVRYLLENRASVDAVACSSSSSSSSASPAASVAGTGTGTGTARQWSSLDCRGKGITALMFASSSASSIVDAAEVVEVLLEYKATVDMQDVRGRTALMHACFKDHGPVVEVLLEARADINKRDSQGITALMHACHLGHYSVVAQLLEEGADITLRDTGGFDALQWTRVVLTGKTRATANDIVKLLKRKITL